MTSSQAPSSVFIVTNANDTGAGSLRDALLQSASAGGGTIQFQIPGSGPFVIQAQTSLSQIAPNTTEAFANVTIDGSSQPGYSGAPLIEVRYDAGNGPFDDALDLGPNSKLVGVSITSATSGVSLDSSDLVTSCWIGVHADGSAQAATPGWGVSTSGSSNVIGGLNVISAWGVGVVIAGSGNVIRGNYIGTDPTGSYAMGNYDGISLDGPSNLVGGPVSEAQGGNVISGNRGNGVVVGTGIFYVQVGNTPPSASSNSIQGNLIGLTSSGDAGLGNGVGTGGAGVYLGLRNDLPITVDSNVVGGPSIDDRNWICASGRGVFLVGTSSTPSNTITNTTIADNYIGVTRTGASSGNQLGVEVLNSTDTVINTTIRGTSVGDQIISGNTEGGVKIGPFYQNPINTVVSNCYIGAGPVGGPPIGNGGPGVWIYDGGYKILGNYPAVTFTNKILSNVISSNAGPGVLLDSDHNLVQGNTVGIEPGFHGNELGNQGDGVHVVGHASDPFDGWGIGNTISQNSIFGNGGQPVHIDGGIYVTNKPVIAAAVKDATNCTVTIQYDGSIVGVNGGSSSSLFDTETLDLRGSQSGTSGMIYLGSTRQKPGVYTLSFAGTSVGDRLFATTTSPEDVFLNSFQNSGSTSVLSDPRTVVPDIQSLKISNSAVQAGKSTSATVTLLQTTPINVLINVSTDSARAQVPATITIPAGSNEGSFAITTTTGSDASCDITAQESGSPHQFSSLLTISSKVLPSSRTLAPVLIGLTNASTISLDRVLGTIYLATDSGIDMVDQNSYTVRGTLPVPGSSAVVALASDCHRGKLGAVTADGHTFVYDGGSQTLTNAATLPAGGAADSASMREPDHAGALYTDDLNGDINVYSTVSGTLKTSWTGDPVSAGSEIALDPLAGKLYVPSQSAQCIDVYSTSDGSLLAKGPVSAGPLCAAVNPNTHRLYVGMVGLDGINVYDITGSPNLIATIPLNGETIRHLEIDRRRQVVWALGTNLYRIEADGNAEEITAPATINGLAVDSVDGAVYATTSNTMWRVAEPAPPAGIQYTRSRISYPDSVPLAGRPDLEGAGAFSLSEVGQLLGWMSLPSGYLSFVNDVDGICYPLFPDLSVLSWSLNANGQVCGSFISNDGSQHAFEGDIDGRFTDLGNFGTVGAEMRAINDAGEGTLIEGLQLTNQLFPTGIYQTYLYSSGGQTSTGLEAGYSINQVGDMAGRLHVNNVQQAALYVTGAMQMIGTLPGGSASLAYGINDLDQAVGVSNCPSGVHAFEWDSLNGMQDISPLGPDQTYAEVVNDNGTIGAANENTLQALLFDPVNGLQDLSSISQGPFDPNDPPLASRALNNSGEVEEESVATAYVLDPVGQVHLQSLSADAADILGGQNTSGKIVLSWPALSGGADVQLSSDTPGVSVPTDEVVSQGQFVAAFPISTTAVTQDTTVLITATCGSTSQAIVLTVHAPALASINVAPGSVIGGSGSTATVTLVNPAPTGGAAVSVSSSDPNAVLASNTVVIPEGSTQGTVGISTSPVKTDVQSTITASYYGTVSTTLKVTAPKPVTVTSTNQSALGGSAIDLTVTLNGPAPSPSYTVALSSNNPNAPVPSSISIPGGSTSSDVVFTTSVVSTTQAAIITATANGASAMETLTIQAAGLVSNTLTPSIVVGGQSSTGTVKLNGAAPSGGATVTLSSSDTAVATVPASVVIPSGQTSATYKVTTISPSSNKAVTITAKYAGLSLGASLTVQAPQLQGLLFLNSSNTVITTAKGGSSIKLKIVLNGAAPSGGAKVTLTSSNKKVLALPTSATVPAGQTSITITLTLGKVSSNTLVTATGTYNASQKSSNLTVTP